MIAYAIANRHRISRLALLVIVGVLESLVEATPNRIGHTYLRSLQNTLHPTGWEQGKDSPYFLYTDLAADDVHNLKLWEWLLKRNDGRRV
jgi:hypothetical protein